MARSVIGPFFGNTGSADGSAFEMIFAVMGTTWLAPRTLASFWRFW